MKKIPYGISNFRTLVEEGYLYVDRTPYIRVLEQLHQRYLFFVRPRRFGKSLFLSVLEYYYDIQYKEQFPSLFSNYSIGASPTPLANQYLVLKFDFSQMDTTSYKTTYQTFVTNVQNGAMTFLGLYPQFFAPADILKVEQFTFPAQIIQYVLRLTRLKAPNQKIYLLIDEYDHFANEILSFRFKEFSEMVGKNGFVRKFYEAVKVGTQTGVIDRIFVTGVFPVTMDYLISAFNIITDISQYKQFSSLVGFTKEEVDNLLHPTNLPKNDVETVLTDLQRYFSGYCFSRQLDNQVYHPDRVNYFISHYLAHQEYPEDFSTSNFEKDYLQIRQLFKIKKQEKEFAGYLQELIENNAIQSSLTYHFKIDQPWDQMAFVNFLYYAGLLTISDLGEFRQLVFKIPNYAIQQLCYQYFHQALLSRVGLM